MLPSLPHQPSTHPTARTRPQIEHQNRGPPRIQDRPKPEGSKPARSNAEPEIEGPKPEAVPARNPEGLVPRLCGSPAYSSCSGSLLQLSPLYLCVPGHLSCRLSSTFTKLRCVPRICKPPKSAEKSQTPKKPIPKIPKTSHFQEFGPKQPDIKKARNAQIKHSARNAPKPKGGCDYRVRESSVLGSWAVQQPPLYLCVGWRHCALSRTYPRWSLVLLDLAGCLACLEVANPAKIPKRPNSQNAEMPKHSAQKIRPKYPPPEFGPKCQPTRETSRPTPCIPPPSLRPECHEKGACLECAKVLHAEGREGRTVTATNSAPYRQSAQPDQARRPNRTKRARRHHKPLPALRPSYQPRQDRHADLDSGPRKNGTAMPITSAVPPAVQSSAPAISRRPE